MKHTVLWGRGAIAALAIVAALLAGTSTVAASDVGGALGLEASDRNLYGFSEAPQDIDRALAVINDHDLDYGTPLTDEEGELLDARNDLVTRFQTHAESVRSRPWFAGVELIHESTGRLRLMTTSRLEAASWVAEAMPADIAAVDVIEVDHSFAKLESAMDEAARQVPGATVSIDATANGLVIEAPSSADTSDIVVPVEYRTSSYAPEVVQACTSRTNCDPYRAGIRVGRASGSFVCTLAFRIKTSDGKTGFWTAGHCGYSNSNNLWYHDEDSLGYEEGSLYNTSSAKDIMRVRSNLANAATSADLYGRADNVSGWEWPVKGSTICASLGKTNVWDCGTVKYEATTWTDTNGVFNYGADHDGISTQSGDSGSPLVRDNGSYYVAVGVHNTSGGKFARVWDVASGSSWFVY